MNPVSKSQASSSFFQNIEKNKGMLDYFTNFLHYYSFNLHLGTLPKKPKQPAKSQRTANKKKRPKESARDIFNKRRRITRKISA